MEYYRKITTRKFEQPIKLVCLLKKYGITIDDKFIGICYYKIDSDIENDLLSKFIHSEFREYFKVSLMIINNDYIPAHTDNELTAVVNLYISTANATTYFWKPKTDILSVEKLEMQTDGRIYKENELECVAEFKAGINDLYVLNVTKIHSVKCGNNIDRIAYCFQTNSLTFDYIVDNISKIFI